MGNVIKYQEGGSETNSVKKGNYWFGVGGRGYGPSNTTGFYAGFSPPENGYVLYISDGGGGVSNYIANNDDELTSLVNRTTGNSFENVLEALNHIASNNDLAVLNSNFEQVVTDGLVLNVDASSIVSYPTTESVWYDLSGNGNDGGLVNGPTFDPNGAIVFDGVDDKIDLNSLITLSGSFTWTATCYSNAMSGTQNRQVYVGGNSTWFEQSDDDTLYVVNNNERSFNLELPTDITPQDKYYNIAVKRKSDNTFDYYFNGVKQTLRNGGDQQVSGSYYINTVGSLGVGRYWNGGINKVQVYNKELTDSEISQNYYGGPIVTDGLVFAVDAGNLVSYESGSTDAYSLTGSINSSLVNEITYLNSNGGHWETDGVDDYISIPGTGDLDFGVNDNFTIETWVNLQSIPSSGNTSAICCKANCCGIDWYFPTENTITFRAGIRNSTDGQQSFGSNNYRSLNQWYHLVFTYTSNQSNGMKLYVNGELDSTLTSVGLSEFSDNTKAFRIGGNTPLGGTGNYSNIKSSTTRMYNKALTADEVWQNYLAQSIRFKNTPQNAITEVGGYAFKIDAANPSSYPGSGNTVTSVGSETFTSTLYGGAAYSSEGGGSFLFDGTDDIAISDISNFNVASMSFSVDTWFKFASPADTGSTDHHAFIGGGGWGGTGDAWYLGARTYTNGYEEANLNFFGQGATGQVPSDYDEQEWNHYCGTYNINTGKAAVYLNGVQISIQDSTYISRTAMPLEWGAVIYSANTPNGIREYYQHGYIGPARIWKDKELSEEEVIQNYNAAKTRFGL